MRIVLLNQYYLPDDVPTAFLLGDLAVDLAAKGHHVEVICSRRGYSDPGQHFARRETIDGVAVRRVFTTGFGRGSFAGRMSDYLTCLGGSAARLILGPRPDVVLSMTNPPLIGAVARFAAALRGARLVYWIMDVYPDIAFELGALRPGSLAGRLLDRLARRVLERSDHVVALGETMAERLRASGARNVSVVHNWVDAEEIRPSPSSGHRLRAEWGWDEFFVVLYSGNMGLAHEFDTVLGAATALRDHPRIRFVFAGGGPRRASVEQYVRDTGLDNVLFRPYVPQESLGQSLTAGDLHLITLRERMPGLLVPSKIYSALAAGRPALYVGPVDGEIPPMLREGECGTHILNGQVDQLREAIEAYAGDPARVAAEGDQARRYYEESFGKQRALDWFSEIVDPTCGVRS